MGAWALALRVGLRVEGETFLGPETPSLRLTHRESWRRGSAFLVMMLSEDVNELGVVVLVS